MPPDDVIGDYAKAASQGRKGVYATQLNEALRTTVTAAFCFPVECGDGLLGLIELAGRRVTLHRMDRDEVPNLETITFGQLMSGVLSEKQRVPPAGKPADVTYTNVSFLSRTLDPIGGKFSVADSVRNDPEWLEQVRSALRALVSGAA